MNLVSSKQNIGFIILMLIFKTKICIKEEREVKIFVMLKNNIKF